MIATPAREALDGAITAIAAAGCDSPRLDAEVLLAHVLGVPRERMAISAAPSRSMGTPITSALRSTTNRSSSSV